MKQQWHSGFDDSSGWGRLIDPVCLFILCQIAGTLWVIVPRQSFAPPVVPNASIDIHRAELAGLLNQQSALEKAVRLANEEAATLAQPVEATVTEKDRLAAQLRIEEQQLKELEAKLDELTRKEADMAERVAGLPPPNPQLVADAEGATQQLAAKQAEIKRLQLALEQTKGSGGSGIGSPRVLDTKLKPVALHLTGNRARPVNDENYKVLKSGTLEGTNRPAQLIGPKTPGETVEDIKKPGSKVAEFLRKIDPEKEYVLCLLSSDSFEIFREMRRIAGEKHIKVGWDTTYRADGTLMMSEGGGKPRGPGETVGK